MKTYLMTVLAIEPATCAEEAVLKLRSKLWRALRTESFEIMSSAIELPDPESHSRQSVLFGERASRDPLRTCSERESWR